LIESLLKKITVTVLFTMVCCTMIVFVTKTWVMLILIITGVTLGLGLGLGVGVATPGAGGGGAACSLLSPPHPMTAKEVQTNKIPTTADV
jgi:hypothetical protein